MVDQTGKACVYASAFISAPVHAVCACLHAQAFICRNAGKFLGLCKLQTDVFSRLQCKVFDAVDADVAGAFAHCDICITLCIGIDAAVDAVYRTLADRRIALASLCHIVADEPCALAVHIADAVALAGRFDGCPVDAVIRDLHFIAGSHGSVFFVGADQDLQGIDVFLDAQIQTDPLAGLLCFVKACVCRSAAIQHLIICAHQVSAVAVVGQCTGHIFQACCLLQLLIDRTLHLLQERHDLSSSGPFSADIAQYLLTFFICSLYLREYLVILQIMAVHVYDIVQYALCCFCIRLQLIHPWRDLCDQIRVLISTQQRAGIFDLLEFALQRLCLFADVCSAVEGAAEIVEIIDQIFRFHGDVLQLCHGLVIVCRKQTECLCIRIILDDIIGRRFPAGMLIIVLDVPAVVSNAEQREL